MMLSKDPPDVPVVFISSHTGKNMDKLKDMLGTFGERLMHPVHDLQYF